MKDKQWVCTFADHRVTETIMGISVALLAAITADEQ